MLNKFYKLKFILVSSVIVMSCNKDIRQTNSIFDGSGNPPSVFTTKRSKTPTDPAFMVAFNIKDSLVVRKVFLKDPLHFDYHSIPGAKVIYNDGSFLAPAQSKESVTTFGLEDGLSDAYTPIDANDDPQYQSDNTPLTVSTGGGSNYSYYNCNYEYDDAYGQYIYGSPNNGTGDPSLDDYLNNPGVSWELTNTWDPTFGGDDIYSTFNFGVGIYPFLFGNGSIVTNPFGDFKTNNEYSAPVFRIGHIIATQGFTRRAVQMTIYVPYRYSVQFSQYTGTFKFIYAPVTDLTGSGNAPIFGISGSKMGEVSGTVYGDVSLDPTGWFAFSGSGLSEKRTKIYSTQGTVKVSTNVNVSAFQIGAELGTGFTISSASNCYNSYYTDGTGQLSASGTEQRPTYSISWTGYSMGPQIE
jgi:hypothetical protein